MKTKLVTLILLLTIGFQGFSQSQDVIAERIKKLSGDVVLFDDSTTRRFIDQYTQNKQQTANVIEKSYRYFPAISDSLDKHGVPDVLRFLTMGLTNFDLKKVSVDGGSGLWQMKYIPAKNNGIRITSYVDYRRDYQQETMATIRYLKELHREFGEWKLTVLAFYSDQFEVQKAMKKAGSDDFAKVHEQMPPKYKDILPKWTAAAYVFTHSGDLNLPKPNVEALPKMTDVSIEKWATFHQISQATSVPVSLLEEANPIFKKGVVPHASYTYDIKIPADKAEKFYELGDKVYEFPTHAAEEGEVNPIATPKTVQPTVTKPATTASGKRSLYYTVRSGDVLGKIADLYDVRISDLRRWNGIRGDRINIGQRLKVYVPASRYTYYSKINRMSSSQKARIRAKD